MAKWHGGKGSSPRKTIDNSKFATGWDRIFAQKEENAMPKVTVYSKDNCPFCVKAKSLLQKSNIEFTEMKVGEDVTREELLAIIPNARSVPQIVINDKIIGGYDDLVEYLENTNFNGTGWTL